MSEVFIDPTPAEALEWALANTPGGAEAFARTEVERLRAVAKAARVVSAIFEKVDEGINKPSEACEDSRPERASLRRALARLDSGRKPRSKRT